MNTKMESGFAKGDTFGAVFSEPATSLFLSADSGIGSSFCFFAVFRTADESSLSFSLVLLYARTPSTMPCPAHNGSLIKLSIIHVSSSCDTEGISFYPSIFHQPRYNFSQFAMPNRRSFVPAILFRLCKRSKVEGMTWAILGTK